jgi:hypothetical protein
VLDVAVGHTWSKACCEARGEVETEAALRAIKDCNQAVTLA